MVYTTLFNYMAAMRREMLKYPWYHVVKWYPSLIGGVAGAWVTASVVEAWRHPAWSPPNIPTWADEMSPEYRQTMQQQHAKMTR